MAATKMNKTMTKIFSAAHRGIYKLSGGRLASSMGDAKIAILTTTGRKSGKSRETPLIALEHADGWVVAASFSGHDVHPAWYLNLQTQPDATLQTGGDVSSVTASDLEGQDRSEWWDKLVSSYSDYAEYQKVTDRQIPVVLLSRR